MLTDACPSISETTLGCTPWSSIRVAAVGSQGVNCQSMVARCTLC
jgi:hypothetical protein